MGRDRMGPVLTPLGTARWADAGLTADPGPFERNSVGEKGKADIPLTICQLRVPRVPGPGPGVAEHVVEHV